MKTQFLLIIAVLLAAALLPDLLGFGIARLLESQYIAKGAIIHRADEHVSPNAQAPKQFKFAAITKNGTYREETYVSRFGEITTFTYQDGIMQSNSSSSLISLIYFIPAGILSFALICAGSLGRVTRTGKLFGTDFTRKEIALMCWGFSLFLVVIVNGIRA